MKDMPFLLSWYVKRRLIGADLIYGKKLGLLRDDAEDDGVILTMSGSALTKSGESTTEEKFFCYNQQLKILLNEYGKLKQFILEPPRPQDTNKWKLKFRLWLVNREIDKLVTHIDFATEFVIDGDSVVALRYSYDRSSLQYLQNLYRDKLDRRQRIETYIADCKKNALKEWKREVVAKLKKAQQDI